VPVLTLQLQQNLALPALLLLLAPALVLPQLLLAPPQLAPLLLLMLPELARQQQACDAWLLAACAVRAWARHLAPSHACTAAVHLLLPSCDQAVRRQVGTRSMAPEGAHVAVQPYGGGHVGALACQVGHPLLLLLLLVEVPSLLLLLLGHMAPRVQVHHKVPLQEPCRGGALLLLLLLQGQEGYPAHPQGLLLLLQGVVVPQLLLGHRAPAAAAAAEGAAHAAGSCPA
jgi:hypothetical protein